MEKAIHIGNSAEVTKLAAEVLKSTILDILGSSAGDEVKIAAINALSKLASVGVEHINITNCIIGDSPSAGDK